MIDVDRIRRTTDLVELVRADGVELKKNGAEYEALCPFHVEHTASFRVVPAKGFMHCFGCGAHYDAIGYVMATRKVDFVEACKQLGGDDLSRLVFERQTKRIEPTTARELWVPVTVPDDAPRWRVGEAADVYNPKRGHWWRGLLPSRADAYRDAAGKLLGYVLRVEARDGRKLTPQVTWCIGPDGSSRWCLQPFWRPRPLFGLDVLAAKPNAPVLIVEGEKCAAVAGERLPMYAVISWPGGSKGVGLVDWSPLRNRTVVLWPDADRPGDEAMFGIVDRSLNTRRRGVAHYVLAETQNVRWVDVAGQPRGWDIADALQVDGWSIAQLTAWARLRTSRVTLMTPSEAADV